MNSKEISNHFLLSSIRITQKSASHSIKHMKISRTLIFLLSPAISSENGRITLKLFKLIVDLPLSWSLRSCAQEPSLFLGGYFSSKQATIARGSRPISGRFWCPFSGKIVVNQPISPSQNQSGITPLLLLKLCLSLAIL